VRTGKVFDLGMPLNDRGPQPGGIRMNPTRRMTVTPADYVDAQGGVVAADDVVIMSLQCATQWDSLAHVGYDGYLYNGVPDSAVNSFGASRNSIDRTIERLAGRGVLLDVARLKGVERMGPGEAISAADLDAAAERQGVEVRSGDILHVRTGWYQRYLEGENAAYLGDQPGLDLSCCEWLHAHEVAAIAMDNVAIEVLPSEVEGIETPLHAVLIRDVGLTLGEMFQLEELAADCEADGVWEFLFAGPPLKFTGAVGSPLSPLALK
jgi:kynurenine formamidase